MRKFWLASLFVISVIGSSTCAARSAPPKGTGDRPRAANSVHVKIVVKRDPDNKLKCVSRTIPKSIQMDFGADDGLVFNVRQHPGAKCLPDGVELELRFTGPNPTDCATPGTAASKNKTRFECNLDQYLANTKYVFKVFRVGTGLPAGGEQLEDPDIEIVQF